jgi:hypothetical protein
MLTVIRKKFRTRPSELPFAIVTVIPGKGKRVSRVLDVFQTYAFIGQVHVYAIHLSPLVVAVPDVNPRRCRVLDRRQPFPLALRSGVYNVVHRLTIPYPIQVVSFVLWSHERIR